MSESKARSDPSASKRGWIEILYGEVIRLLPRGREGGDALVFGGESLKAVLAGEKTVSRRPVQFTEVTKPEGGKAKEPQPSNYKAGATCPLLRSPLLRVGPARPVSGHQLRIKSVRMVLLSDVTDKEAKLEGFADRIDFLLRWYEKYGPPDFEQYVWRYEFELIVAPAKR